MVGLGGSALGVAGAIHSTWGVVLHFWALSRLSAVAVATGAQVRPLPHVTWIVMSIRPDADKEDSCPPLS